MNSISMNMTQKDGLKPQSITLGLLARCRFTRQLNNLASGMGVSTSYRHSYLSSKLSIDRN
ncbi:hypothetical protein [Vibrio crassostreae]|uniref:hypothetical protein n=1 Tax=Vibrio crassostreae TaxID=246167 RepID=UPI003D0FFB19